jgi:indole-3-glycerol phosphate synthase
LPVPSEIFPMNKLDEIVAYKKQEIEHLIPLTNKLKASALMRNDFGGFRSALERGEGKLGVISEVKKASPSAGVIDPNFDPVRQAQRYIDGGASCMSILTDEKFFQGHLSYLTQISKISPIPLLRKDFTVHECQIYEAIISGADAILLIVACLDDDLLKHLYETAKDFQLDVLVEVHDLPEMERALDLGADLIGINNRNLKTFTTDLTTTESLADEVPADVILVSESGLKSPQDAQQVLDYGANAVLIGEALMRADNPSREIEKYLALEASVLEEGV